MGSILSKGGRHVTYSRQAIGITEFFPNKIYTDMTTDKIIKK